MYDPYNALRAMAFLNSLEEKLMIDTTMQDRRVIELENELRIVREERDKRVAQVEQSIVEIGRHRDDIYRNYKTLMDERNEIEKERAELQIQHDQLQVEYKGLEKDAIDTHLEHCKNIDVLEKENQELRDRLMDVVKDGCNDFDQYQKLSAERATYPGCTTPGAILGLAYVGLGLGESGEAQGKIKKVLRDHDGIVTEELKKGIVLELGDTLWYLSETARQLGVSLSEVAQANVDKLKDRKERGVIKGEGDYR